MSTLNIGKDLEDKIKQIILNTYFPIGTYYETINIDFNPNFIFGGTWAEETIKDVVASCEYDFGTICDNNNIKSIKRYGTSTWEVIFENSLANTYYVPLLSAERSGIGVEVIMSKVIKNLKRGS